MASSNRLERINEDIQRVLSSLLRDIKDPRVRQGMISITAVDTTSDLRFARVFLSVFNPSSEKEFMKGIKSASGYLRGELGRALTLRYTPELIFELDRSIERGSRINSILSNLEIPMSEDGQYDEPNSDEDENPEDGESVCNKENGDAGEYEQ